MAAIDTLRPLVGLSRACEALGEPRSRVYRARRPAPRPSTPADPRSSRALSPDERARVREALNSDRFADCAPREVYATLLDAGVYHCSWRTMYRILTDHAEVRERRDQARHPSYSKPELLATAPNHL